MLFAKVALLAALSVGTLANPQVKRASKNSGANAKADAATTTSSGDSSLTLDTDAVQTGSFVDGSAEIGAEAGEALSQTSKNNFINFCSGKTLTNGIQVVGGSCNGIVMGDIPAKTNMVSSIITFPQTGSVIKSDTTFAITVQMANLVAGSFTNADSTYYAGPQFLSGGDIVGHTHVTVQDLGKSLNPTVALDATQFAFFKGINDAGNGKGLLTANVTGGLPAGNYRVCTLASASNHQPVLMPVAQRGTSDDCTKFVVNGDGTTINVASNDGSKGEAAAAAVSEAAVGATNSAFAASVLASESAAAAAAATATAEATATGTADKGAKKAKTSGKKSKPAKASASVSASAKAKATSKAKASKQDTSNGGYGKQRFSRRQFVA